MEDRDFEEHFDSVFGQIFKSINFIDEDTGVVKLNETVAKYLPSGIDLDKPIRPMDVDKLTQGINLTIFDEYDGCLVKKLVKDFFSDNSEFEPISMNGGGYLSYFGGQEILSIEFMIDNVLASKIRNAVLNTADVFFSDKQSGNMVKFSEHHTKVAPDSSIVLFRFKHSNHKSHSEYISALKNTLKGLKNVVS
jgi:hypothetical protein